jgi:hypothetical protein
MMSVSFNSYMHGVTCEAGTTYPRFSVKVIDTFLYQMMFVSFNSNMKGSNSGAGSAYPSGAPHVILCFSWGGVAQC